MKSENEIDAALGKDGAKINLKGEVAERASRGVGDIFKPLVQFLGEKGDAIEHRRRIKKQVRVFNELALEQSLRLSQSKAEEHGLAIQPVPLKFLAQWAEGASLEDPDDEENLAELWSNLLVSNIEGEVANSLIYIDLIKKIKWRHKVALEKFYVQSFPDKKNFSIVGNEVLHSSLLGLRFLNAEEKINKAMLEPIVRRLFFDEKGALISGFDLIDYDVWSEGIDEISQNSNFPESFTENISKLTSSASEYTKYDLGISEEVLNGLRNLNLIEKCQFTGYELSEKFRLNVFFWKLTVFGIDFLENCIRPDNQDSIITDGVP